MVSICSYEQQLQFHIIYYVFSTIELMHSIGLIVTSFMGVAFGIAHRGVVLMWEVLQKYLKLCEMFG